MRILELARETKALAEKATPGPWITQEAERDEMVGVLKQYAHLEVEPVFGFEVVTKHLTQPARDILTKLGITGASETSDMSEANTEGGE